jgi:hypothetical protein
MSPTLQAEALSNEPLGHFGRPKRWTKKLWVYDLRTNKHFTQKQSPITRKDFDEFVDCYRAGAVNKRKPTGSEENPDERWRCYTYDEILKRGKLSLDLFWIKDQSLTDAAIRRRSLLHCMSLELALKRPQASPPDGPLTQAVLKGVCVVRP